MKRGNVSNKERLARIVNGRTKVKLSEVHDNFLDRWPRYSLSRVQIKSLLNMMGYRVTEWGADVYIKQ